MTSHYDIVVVGGGIHGVGVAQAAAAAGYSALLLEKTALAAGTSSRSSKLIHGGLRYLESGQFRLVRESLRERAILLRIAPNLVHRVPFHIPIYASTHRRPWLIAAGLSLYAVLGGLNRDNRFTRVPRAAWSTLDGLDVRGLQCLFRYYDAQTDDAALTRAVMTSAQSLGAELRCPADFQSADYDGERLHVTYVEGKNKLACTATTIVNAGGPWANAILKRIAPTQSAAEVDLVQGTRIVVDSVTQSGVFYLEASDGRAVFAMPWRGKTLVGTTETAFYGDPAQDQVRPKETTYLLETYQRYFPGRASSFIDSFAGLRVLPAGKNTLFHRSRETVFHVDDAQRPRILTLYGGKLTGYRFTAERVIHQLRTVLPERAARADTARLMLRGD